MFRRRSEMVVVFICNLMRIGRWFELSVNRVCQEHEVMRADDANRHLANSALRLAELSWGYPS